MGLSIRAGELSTIVGLIKLDGNVVNSWHWNLNFDVLQIASVKIDLWNREVLQDSKDVRHDDILGIIGAFLGNGDTCPRSLGRLSRGTHDHKGRSKYIDVS